MTYELSLLSRNYAKALDDYLGGAGEAALHQAYEIGRQALVGEIGVLDIAAMHHAALASGAGSSPERLGMAAEFLAECLSSFEMTLLGYRETNARLARLNETLTRANAEAEAANRRLLQEMSDRQRAEDALRQSQRLQAIGRLAGGVAHHFNNLLTVVLGNIDMARRGLDDETSRMLARALSAGQRGVALTRLLLSFSGQQMIDPKVIDPAIALNAATAMLAGTLGDTVKVVASIAPGLAPVEIDSSELELALLNLAINARDAMPGGGVLRIGAAIRRVEDVRLGLSGRYLVIEVQDDGVGIPPDILPRVFDPFFTTKPVGAGSGLGLSQVHGFARQAGGGVDIESQLDKGTTARLYLPVAGRHAASETAPPPALGSADGTILVVEDEKDVADLAAVALTTWGFSVKRADRAQSAFDLLQQGERVDLVFTDIVMPDGISGIELAEQVHSRYPEIPVLLATGYSDASAAAIARGMEIIAKPYRDRELCNSVTRLLKRRGE